jgi:hypothetical protein
MVNPVISSGPGALLHVGCGRERLEGWVNIDIQELPGVDVVADVTRGLHFREARALFAEHFLEHLTLEQALDFLQESRRALAAEGWIRLTTPNLEWVWQTHYAPGAPPPMQRLQCLRMNRAFYGWGHRFLWNRTLLAEAVAACGFEELRWCVRGESELPFFRGVERHPPDQDTAELPHVLILEARHSDPKADLLAAFRATAEEELLAHVRAR